MHAKESGRRGGWVLGGFLCVLSTLLFLPSFSLCTVVALTQSPLALALAHAAQLGQGHFECDFAAAAALQVIGERERELTFALRCINNDAHDDDDAVGAENWVESCT